MKKSSCLFLALVLCLSMMILGFSGCGATETTYPDTTLDPDVERRNEFEKEVESAVAVEIILTYGATPIGTDLATINIDGNTYTAYGKVTVKDKYGDTYVGKVTAKYEYDEDFQRFVQKELDIETPIKQSN